MKRIIIFAGLFVGVILGAENIPLDKWSIPEGAWARGEELSITSGGRKHGELMWAPFRKVGKNRVWQLKATIVGKGEIQASLGCYSVDKKRFLTRHPFAVGTKKINTDFPVEEIWYLTLPENIKEPAGWIRPALRIVSGKFSIRQTQIEAFEKMPLLEENLPLAKWLIPASAKRGEAGITAVSGGKTHGELLWGPIRPTGEVKVWQVTVELAGKGEIQASLGCYDASGKRFLARYPFSLGTRKIDTVNRRKESWFLELPKDRSDIFRIRPALRIVSGKFEIRQIYIKELREKPPRENYLDTTYKMPGEVLPAFSEPNLFPGFPEPGKKDVGLQNELVLVNSKNASLVYRISKPIPVESGRKYILTGLYHSHDLKFGNAGTLVILPEEKAAYWPASLDGFKPYSPLCIGELVNRSPGEWQRKVVVYTVPENVKKIRIGVYLRGNPASIKWRSIYFGLGPWENDTRKLDFDLTWHYRKNTELLPQNKVAEILASRSDATAEVLPGNSPKLLINGKKELPLIYFGDAFAPERNKTAAFQQAGVDLQIIPLLRKDYYWVGNGQYRFDRFDRDRRSGRLCMERYHRVSADL